MFEKIREKWKKAIEEDEIKSVEYCRKHPKRWRLAMTLFVIGYLLCMALCCLFGIWPFAIIILIGLLVIYRGMHKFFRKAFPKSI